MSDYQLGKKIVPVAPAPVADEYEEVRTQHGWMLRNKRTGFIEKTVITPTGPQYAPAPPPVPTEPNPPITTEQWDAMIAGLPEAIKQQIDDGFDPVFWGSC